MKYRDTEAYKRLKASTNLDLPAGVQIFQEVVGHIAAHPSYTEQEIRDMIAITLAMWEESCEDIGVTILK